MPKSPGLLHHPPPPPPHSSSFSVCPQVGNWAAFVVSIINLVLWGEVISPTPNPQTGGGGAGCFFRVSLLLVTDSS